MVGVPMGMGCRNEGQVESYRASLTLVVDQRGGARYGGVHGDDGIGWDDEYQGGGAAACGVGGAETECERAVVEGWWRRLDVGELYGGGELACSWTDGFRGYEYGLEEGE